jgi:hypothetical protein
MSAPVTAYASWQLFAGEALRAPLRHHEVEQELERDRRLEVADAKRAKREAKMSDRDTVQEAVDVLWDTILRADNDQAVVTLLGSGRQWQDHANAMRCPAS